MNDKTIELLSRLADKFGTTVDHLWGVLVKQAYVGAVAQIIVCLLVFIGISVILAVTRRQFKADYESDQFTPSSLMFIIAAMVAAMYALGFLFGASELITRLINPEYWALKQILP